MTSSVVPIVLDSSIAAWARKSAWVRPIGIAAYRAFDRVRPARPGPRILANALPKSGTHLLMGVLDQVPGVRFNGRLVWVLTKEAAGDGRQGVAKLRREAKRVRPSGYAMGHVVYSPAVSAACADVGLRVVTVLRDPRAVLASAVRYFEENPLRRRDIAHHQFAGRQALVEWLLDGDPPGTPDRMPPFGYRTSWYTGWLDDPRHLVVHFEDLVGAAGGGSADVQRETIARILDFTGLDDRAAPDDLAAAMAPSKSHTFSVGKVRSWDAVLTPAQVVRVEQECADLIDRLARARKA